MSGFSGRHETAEGNYGGALDGSEAGWPSCFSSVAAHHLPAIGQAFRTGRLGPQGRFRDASQAHVEDLDGTLLAQKQVARLDVAVDDPLGVRVL